MSERLRTTGALARPEHGADADPLTCPMPAWRSTETSERLGVVVDRLEAISLTEAGAVASPDRLDTKFLFSIESLPAIVESLGASYRVLEIDGKRFLRYRSRYFDSPDLRLYHAHQTGRVPRQKLRIREYPDTGVSFAEVKRKTNKGRTTKSRTALPQDDLRDPSELLAGLAVDSRRPLLRAIREAVRIDYTRVTLVAKGRRERVTFDLNLECARDGVSRSFAKAVITELKQERPGRSPTRDVMRKANVRETEFSKYCLGLASLDPSLKRNQFKVLLRDLENFGGNGPAESPMLAPSRT